MDQTRGEWAVKSELTVTIISSVDVAA